MINWEDPNCRVSDWFTVKECLWLPTWGRLANENDGLNDSVKNSLYALCSKLDHIREFFLCPMIVDCMYRPPSYSKLVGGFETDVHTMGEAADFKVGGIYTEDAKKLLEPSLEALGVRMEDNPGSDYIHIDIHSPGLTGRYFKP